MKSDNKERLKELGDGAKELLEGAAPYALLASIKLSGRNVRIPPGQGEKSLKLIEGGAGKLGRV
ncbi:MAG: hypothetical protein LBS62_05390 [Clostridiales bacterium]|jgi:hypothetical protein|nr:hypothetical protein [Clostridiales bacterium]